MPQFVQIFMNISTNLIMTYIQLKLSFHVMNKKGKCIK